MNVVLALAAFSREAFQLSSIRDAGLFALDFSEQELGQRAMPVWLFDAEPVRIPPPRRESPETWADRWLTHDPPDGGSPEQDRRRGSLALVSGELFQDRRQLAPLQRAVVDVCTASGARPTVALVFLTGRPLDDAQALRVMAEAAAYPVFWVFLTASRSDERDGPGEARQGSGTFDFLDRVPEASTNFAVIRTSGWSSWARLRRSAAVRRAVSRWLRSLPPTVVEPPEEEPTEPADAPANPTGSR
ncbi:VWA domain-containing protein [Streptomyces sp. YC504]|uniref:VWA domain-containing protein n=1 Tax=Streptomyces mesophilus TaxID=1775132 RepID=A0A6G4XV21_9ACTN|nr:VWA domain-containing protein [Streptomyces mesophilus]NGO80451.1 VWA domain-containing protein [Streptomyces mesophilus]